MEFVPLPALRDPAGTDGVPESLHRVRHIVGVGSCKGGVGKSTVTVNLAFALAALGARVRALSLRARVCACVRVVSCVRVRVRVSCVSTPRACVAAFVRAGWVGVSK